MTNLSIVLTLISLPKQLQMDLLSLGTVSPTKSKLTLQTAVCHHPVLIITCLKGREGGGTIQKKEYAKEKKMGIGYGGRERKGKINRRKRIEREQ